LSTQEQNQFAQAYYGAATQVIKPKSNKGYYYDINSLYPYAMKKPMPVGKSRPYAVSKALENLFGIALGTVKVPKHIKYPSLPHRKTIKGVPKLIFPHGSWTGYYWAAELQYAATQGCDIKLIKA